MRKDNVFGWRLCVDEEKEIRLNNTWLGRHWQKVVAAALWLTMIGALVYFMRANDLTLPELFLAGMAWVQNSSFAPLAYIAIYAIRPLTLFSATLLTVAGGFLFGPVWGIVYTVIGANLSATVAFFIGRYFGQGLLDDETSSGWVQRYARRMRQNSFETVLIMRFIFIPYDLVNYLSGFLRIGYWSFLLATALGSIPGTISFVLLGSSLAPEQVANLFLTGEVPNLDWRLLAVSALMFVVSIALSRYFKRREAGAAPRLEPDTASEVA